MTRLPALLRRTAVAAAILIAADPAFAHGVAESDKAYIQANPFVIDAIIGMSVVYKALDNLGAYPTWFGVEPNQKAAVLIFGFFHGFGLATKIQDLSVSRDGLFANLVSFNVGVEIGQFLALCVILIAMTIWRRTPSFSRSVVVANTVLMAAGLILVGYQITGYAMERAA